MSPDISPRELQIGTLVAEGKTNPEIAAELGITVSTVDNTRRRLFIKTGVRNAVELTHYAIRNGWVRVKGMPGRPRKVKP